MTKENNDEKIIDEIWKDGIMGLNFNDYETDELECYEDAIKIFIKKAIQKTKEETLKEEISFLIDLKHNYNHEGESYKKIQERINKLKQGGKQ